MSELNMTLRRQGVTGSEIAKVAGVSRYGGPLEVWARKMGHTPDQPDNPQMARGRHLEPALCSWAASVVGLYPADVGTLQSRENPLVIASPDRLLFRTESDALWGKSAVQALEVKAPAYTMHHWTRPEDDSAGIDPEYLPQVTWEMLAAGLDLATVAALCYGDLWVYQIALDRELAGLLIQAAERFWRDHIVTGRPPAPTMGADAEVLRRIYPTNRAPLLEADEAIQTTVRAWHELEAVANARAEEADTVKARVMAAIGAARIARRLRVSPATVRLYCHAEASPYMVRRWMASERGAEWCRAMVRGARRGRVDAAMERAQARQTGRTTA